MNTRPITMQDRESQAEAIRAAVNKLNEEIVKGAHLGIETDIHITRERGYDFGAKDILDILILNPTLRVVI